MNQLFGLHRHATGAVRYALRQPGLLFVLIAVIVTWGFIKLASKVGEGETLGFDRAILTALRNADDPQRLRGPFWFGGAVRDVTALGGETILTLVTVLVCGYLAMAGRGDLSRYAALSVVTGAIVMYALKAVFARQRPDLVPHILTDVSSGSFPSGHAMLSAVVYLTLGGMLAEAAQHRRLQVYAMTAAILLTLAIGSTRVFLGVHYPTDVLAGWTVGFLWAFGCRTAVRLLESRAAPPPSDTDPAAAGR